MINVDRVTIPVEGTGTVSGLLSAPAASNICFVLAHGAGAGMTHSSLEAMALGLGERGICTLRFQFPYMERGSRRPDKPEVAHKAVRAAVATARELLPEAVLFAGGRSFGGRMTSQAQALSPLPCVGGLVFFAFPLHPAGRVSVERADHLSAVHIPMLFLQGTRDDLAHVPEMRGVCERLGQKASLKLLDHADHAFQAPARSGRSKADILREMLDHAAEWTKSLADIQG
jgi:predicted alpha/beta-hydrolase family hydrolase